MKRILFFPDATEPTSATNASAENPVQAAAPVADPAPEPKLTAEQERKIAIQAYNDAPDRAGKAAAVKKYPVLATIYSAGNHN